MRDEAKNTERHQTIPGTALRNMSISFIAAGTLDPKELFEPLAADPAAKVEEDSSEDEDTELPVELTGADSSYMEEQADIGDETEANIDVGKINLGEDEVKEASGPASSPEPDCVKVEAMLPEEPEQVSVPTIQDQDEEMQMPLSVPTIPDQDEEVPGFIMDLAGDVDMAPKIKIPIVRAPSPTPSVSSDASEKIVFIPRGNRNASKANPPIKSTGQTSPRKAPTKSNGQKSPRKSRSTSPQKPLPTVYTQIGTATPEPPKPRVVTTRSEPIIIDISLPQLQDEVADSPEPEADFLQLNGESKWNGKRVTNGNKRRKGKKKQRGRGCRAAEQEAHDDYLENVAASMRAEAAENSEMASDGFGLLCGEGVWADDSSTDEDDAASDSDAVKKYKGGWDDDALNDFGDISTDEEGPKGLVSRVLTKRTRPSGLQYLIKWDGYETDDATWTLSNTLDSAAGAKVKAFDEALAENIAQMKGSSDSESSDELDEDDGDEDDEDDEDDDDIDRRLEEFENILKNDYFPMVPGMRNKKRISRQMVPDVTMDPSTGRYPSASEIAAAYDAFDVMDRERPSISAGSKSKGKGRVVQLSHSESELEAQITNTWQRDRESKKLRKLQREQLRRDGLLGVKVQKTGKINMLDKYKEGTTMTKVYDEICNFMLNDHSWLVHSPHPRDLPLTKYLQPVTPTHDQGRPQAYT